MVFRTILTMPDSLIQPLDGNIFSVSWKLYFWLMLAIKKS